MTLLPEFMLILGILVSFSALNDLYTMTLRSYGLDNIIFGLLIPENPYVDTKNLILV